MTINPTVNMPLASTALVMFVRARVEGQSLLTGSSTRRLVQVTDPLGSRPQADSAAPPRATRGGAAPFETLASRAHRLQSFGSSVERAAMAQGSTRRRRHAPRGRRRTARSGARLAPRDARSGRRRAVRPADRPSRGCDPRRRGRRRGQRCEYRHWLHAARARSPLRRVHDGGCAEQDDRHGDAGELPVEVDRRSDVVRDERR